MLFWNPAQIRKVPCVKDVWGTGAVLKDWFKGSDGKGSLTGGFKGLVPDRMLGCAYVIRQGAMSHNKRWAFQPTVVLRELGNVVSYRMRHCQIHIFKNNLSLKKNRIFIHLFWTISQQSRLFSSNRIAESYSILIFSCWGGGSNNIVVLKSKIEL